MALEGLITQAQKLIASPPENFPIQIFHCREKQQLHRVHFFQATMMLVLRGTKKIYGPLNENCTEGSLILVSSSHEFPFANIPNDFYMALAIEFAPEDFPARALTEQRVKLEVKEAPKSLLTITQQLLDLGHSDMPTSVLRARRKELAALLSILKLDTVLRCSNTPSWRIQLVNLLRTDLSKEWKLNKVCKALATSESNLRRRLQQENTGFRQVLEDLRLNSGLAMIQTSNLPINQIALECGYQSASRFSERFKKHFQTSPSELRQAR
jgi:AraC-like DNA-binding protein